MGCVARETLCDRYVEAFDAEILPRVAIEGEFVVAQAILADEDFNVRLHVTVRDGRCDEHALLGELIIFHPHMTRDDAVDALYGLLHGDEDSPERLAELQVRMAAVFA